MRSSEGIGTTDTVTLELDPAETTLVLGALRSFEYSFGHDEADILRRVQAVLARLTAASGRSEPDRHSPVHPPRRFATVVVALDDDADDNAALVFAQRFAELNGSHVVSVHGEPGRGVPARLVAETARTANADLVIVADDRHAPPAELLAGNAARQLLDLCPCPVLVVPDRTGTARPNGARAT